MASTAHARPLAPESNGTLGVTYAETLSWAIWLGIFTTSDLADAMAVDRAVAERGIVAMRFHAVVEDTGDFYGGQTLWEYRTYAWPPDPTHHPTKPPEWQTCEREIIEPRGMPVRLVDKNQDRRGRSMPGQAHRMRQREKRYTAMMEKREEAYEKSLAKAQKEPKWKRRK